MTRSQDNIWLHRFALLTAAATFCLIWVGGLTTSHGAGMAVPDWPTTYGYNMFFFPYSRWVGGIFYDHLECESEAMWEANFAFTRAVGEAFLAVFPALVRRRMGMEFTSAQKQQQLEWRGRYAEFNLVYDRGTLFGLKTGGNIDAILMSLPPEAVWS